MRAASVVKSAQWVFGECAAELVEEPVETTFTGMFKTMYHVFETVELTGIVGTKRGYLVSLDYQRCPEKP